MDAGGERVRMNERPWGQFMSEPTWTLRVEELLGVEIVHKEAAQKPSPASAWTKKSSFSAAWRATIPHST